MCARCAWLNPRKNFYIAYNTPHKISFQMNSRSSLFDLRFSQILRHRMSTVLLFKLYVFEFQISISYDLIIAAFSNFDRSLKGTAKCFGMIFVTIGKQYHSKTAILKLCARVVRVHSRAVTFNISYSMLHNISFRMSGRSSLCDLWFFQTIRHKFDLYIYMYKSTEFEKDKE